MRKLTLLAVLVVLVSCTDAGMAKVTSLGNKAHVTCWSGSVKIYEGRSTGKVANEDNSDGYFFVDSIGPVGVSGNCVIRYDK